MSRVRLLQAGIAARDARSIVLLGMSAFGLFFHPMIHVLNNFPSACCSETIELAALVFAHCKAV